MQAASPHLRNPGAARKDIRRQKPQDHWPWNDMDSSETSPLLSPVKSHQDEPTRIKREKARPAVIVLLLLLYTIFLDLGFYLMEPAQTRIFERIYCREYYEKRDPSLIGSDGRGGVDEKWCKVSWV
ncbi:hypothetical protein H634G_07583 [Metarhizium anisopliae BRIP 53293]|uniref:Uncharacterized protein n=1 Tax=Metarhizium anisopliae BRIP 53293 TaxID=1291518 RepID=A0A0D9NSG8_METAN|nr:hypothetical protein H634G_07583 [Metarhizium anisopliae BRIP 53293]KJK85708.1 hypothetical protein H633G_10447 [Metarhizium anisopliae BRIP 53284]